MCSHPARVRKPRDKALVKGAVKLIYRSIYTKLDGREFYDLESLNAAIRVALELHNNALLTGRNYSRREQYEDYKREKQLREQAEHDLNKLKHSLDVMTTMCEMVTQPTQQIITEQVNRRISTYKSEAIKLNEKIVELRNEDLNLETINRELLKRIVILENEK